MKYTLTQVLNKLKGSKNVKIIIMFVVVLPLFAIVFGNILARYVIIPLSNNDLKKTKKAVNVINTNNHIYNVYYIQMGVFTNKANAEVLKKALIDLGINCVIVKDNDIYRIIAGISEKDDFTELKKKFKEFKYDYIIKECFIGIIDNDDDIAMMINEYIKNVINIIKYQIVFINSDSKKMDNDIIENMKNYTELLKQTANKINNSKADKKIIGNFKVSNEMIIQNLEKYIICLEKNDKISGFENLANELFLLKSLYDFISQSYIK
ncbi:MAG: SPOR domain-containing protein [Caloramator sp.]|nr:SPOR domain-containing protein [Caloramator sp.]